MIGAGAGAAAGAGAGFGAGAGVVPVPLTAMLCVAAAVLSAKVSDALRAPAAPGVNVTPTLQVAPEAMVAPAHVLLVIAKSLALAPVTVTPLIVRLDPAPGMPALLTVS